MPITFGEYLEFAVAFSAGFSEGLFTCSSAGFSRSSPDEEETGEDWILEDVGEDEPAALANVSSAALTAVEISSKASAICPG